MKRTDKRQAPSAATLGLVLVACLLLVYYFHSVLKAEVVFTHLLYVPIILASMFWTRKGIAVAVFLALWLLMSHVISPLETPLAPDIARSLMFVVVGTVVAILSETRQRQSRLLAYSEALERKVEERTLALRKTEEKNRAILNGIRDGIIVLDDDLNIIWANEVALGQYGAALGKKCYEAYTWMKEPCAGCIVRKTYADGMSRAWEQECVLKDGRRIDFVASCSPVRDSEGKVASVVEVLHDITERKYMEERLRESQENVRLMISEVKDYAILMLDSDGNVASWNEGAQHIGGYASEEIVGKHFSIFYPKEDVESGKPEQALSVAVAHGRLEDHGWRVRKNGSRFWANVVITALRDESGNLIGFSKITRDMTEQKRAQEALLERQRHETERVQAELAKVSDELVRKTRLAAIGQVSASIAHDLRNPLGAARNSTFFLKRRFGAGEPKLAQHLGIIDEEVAKADCIITNLLTMTRAGVPDKRAVDLGQIVREVLKEAPRVEGVGCRMTMVPDPFKVQADPDQFRQVIRNLFDNAVDAMGGHGVFLVEASSDSDYDTLVFRDSGPGFSADVRGQMFEPLVTTKASGTGLGLAICRRIIENHGGEIEAPEGEGQGGVVRIRLPRS